MSKAFPTNSKDVGAPATRRCDVAQSPFLWDTGAPSCLYTEAGHRAAVLLTKGTNGKAVDSKGRAQVDLAPHHKQSIQITNRADAIKTQLIKRGTSI
jgi:hypothetical protein